MVLQWKSFNIDLPSFYKFVKSNIPHADGIIANSEYFEIVEIQPFTNTDIALINDYYGTLTEQGELDKINFKSSIPEAIINCKNSILNSLYDDLSSLQKKVLLSLQLSDSELVELVNIYKNQ